MRRTITIVVRENYILWILWQYISMCLCEKDKWSVTVNIYIYIYISFFLSHLFFSDFHSSSLSSTPVVSDTFCWSSWSDTCTHKYSYMQIKTCLLASREMNVKHIIDIWKRKCPKCSWVMSCGSGCEWEKKMFMTFLTCSDIIL